MSYRYLTLWSVFLLLLLSAAVDLHAQSWQWADGAGGTGNDLVGGIAVDSAGNTYVVGTFDGNITFNTTTFANGPNTGLFLAKYDPVGDLLWATYAGGAGNFQNPSIAITKFGDLFISGSFNGQVTFGTDQLRSVGGTDIFISRYDSNGVRIWSRRDGSTADEVSRGIAIAATSEVVISGYYRGFTTIANTSLPNAGGTDIFIAKYEGTGLPRWGARAGGRGDDESRAVSLDASGGIYIAGSIADSSAFGTDTLAGVGGSDAYVAKFSAAGAPLWVTSFGSVGNDSTLALVADRFGNTYVAGSFTDTMRIDGALLGSIGLSDAFVAKLDGGGSMRWIHGGGGGDSDAASAIAIDALGAVYITGHYFDSASFGALQLDDTSGNGDIFVVKYDGDGVLQWGLKGGGLGYDDGRAIGVDLRSDVRVAGSISDAALFGSNQVGNAAAIDAFVARIGPAPTITTGGIVVGPFCPGAKFNVPFTFTGIYGKGNSFAAQLSDSNGSFESSLVIGRLIARQGALVPATIPADIAPGRRYRVRVVSTEPAVIGSSNSGDLTINPIPAPVIVADGPLSICGGSSVTLDAGEGYRSYRWSNGLASRTIAVTQAGDYTVTVTNTSGCEGTSFAVPVRVTAPEKPTITRTGGILQSSAAASYRWSLNGAAISGATAQSYQPVQEGSYTVTISDTGGCSATSDPFFFSTLDVDAESAGGGLALYPHPNRGVFTVELPLAHAGIVEIAVTDAAGRSLRQWSGHGEGAYRRTLDISDLPAGVYFVTLTSGGERWVRKVVKE